MDVRRSKSNKWMMIIAIAIFLLYMQAGVSFADTDRYEIKKLQMDALVDERYCVQVSEMVDAAFHQETEEVFRRIPLLHNGIRYELSDLRGEGVVVQPQWKRDEVILRIKKQSDVFFGNEKFRISYELQGSADESPEGDMFALSVVSPDWDTYIHQVNVRVELPVAVPENMVEFRGSLEALKVRDTMAVTVDQNRIDAESSVFLVPKETVFLQVQLPNNTFSQAVSLHTFYERTESLSLGLILGTVLIAFGFWFWAREKNREPALRAEPPYQASPSEIQYLFTGQVDTRDLSILFLEWANRGWIHIFPPDPGKGGNENAAITLERRPPNDITPFELRFFHLLFDEYGSGQRISPGDLRGDFHRHLASLKTHLATDFGKGDKAFYKTHETKNTIGLTILASLPIFFFWIRVGLENYRGWIAGLLSVGLMLIQLVSVRWLEVSDRGRKRAAGGLLLLGLGGLSLYYGRGIGYIMALAAGLLIVYLVRRSEKRTPYGAERIRQFMGYRKFLAGEKQEELRMLIQQSPELYFGGLSYAERLGVLEEWKNQFKEIFILSPIWYHGKESMDFSVEEFNREILRFFEAFDSAMEAKS